jgi:apolipoprotein N-acyltransferase
MTFLIWLGACFFYVGCQLVFDLLRTPPLDSQQGAELFNAMLLFFGGALICWCSAFIVSKLDLVLKHLGAQ